MGLLSWIGRQRTRAIAALVLIGILLPPLGAVLKPYVSAFVSVFPPIWSLACLFSRLAYSADALRSILGSGR